MGESPEHPSLELLAEYSWLVGAFHFHPAMTDADQQQQRHRHPPERADCRICLEPASAANPVVAPCECSGTCAYVHVSCLERWVVEKGSGRCEVCKAVYKQKALTPLGRRRIAEMELMRLGWPQNGGELGAEEALLLTRPTLAAPSTRRLMLLSALSLLCLVFVLVHSDAGDLPRHAPRTPALTESEAIDYMEELGLAANALIPRGAGGSSEADAGVGVGGGTAVGDPSWHSLVMPPAPPPNDDVLRAVVPSDKGGDEGEAAGSMETADAGGWDGDVAVVYDSGGDAAATGADAHEAAASRCEGAPCSPPPPPPLPPPSPAPPPSSDEGSSDDFGAWLFGGFASDAAAGAARGGGGGPVPPSAPAPSPSLPPTDAEVLLQRLMIEEGCASEGGDARPSPPPPDDAGGALVAGSSGGAAAGVFRSRCERAELVLLFLRRRHEESREADADRAAGEAMARLTRAFVLLCLLRIVIAHTQRRRIVTAQWGVATERPPQALGGVNNV